VMHQHGTVPGNIRTSRPISALISQHARSVKVRRSLCIAAGFGGPVAVISLISA
jgi:hypothetical protein